MLFPPFREEETDEIRNKIIDMKTGEIRSPTLGETDRINLSRTFKYLMATQFLSRGIPFSFNSWIVRRLMRDGPQMEENTARILKIAWMTFPLGIFVTTAACIFVFWLQGLKSSNPYAQAFLIHGTSEAFVHAVANESQLKQSNDSLLIFSGIYILLNILLVRSAGAVGLIAANSLNMILRIMYSRRFIKHYFRDSPSFAFRQCLPSAWEVVVLSGTVTFISKRLVLDRENFWRTMITHVTIGILCFSISSIVIYRRERPFINRIIRLRDHAE
ncbi:uncharacterized protein LOC143883503 isoform X2 [Tasmannia lanceolata]|uniref:uncharacterized protein LOC143883503 isoform X2 n=1 Tax=Tasmannia lanceolata TaxID=3420 RepID=UPI0040629424